MHTNGQLIETGLLLGFLHVALGPDHLSALATLSVGNSYRAFNLGVRWGLGHSTGLVSIAVVFIALKGNLDLRGLAKRINVVLGVFMVVIGASGIVSAFRASAEKHKKRDGKVRGGDDDDAFVVPKNGVPSSSSGSRNKQHISEKRERDIEKQQVLSSVNAGNDSDSRSSMSSAGDDEGAEEHLDCCGVVVSPASLSSSLDMRDPFTQRLISFTIGILHGAAGPGAILGVLPAVEMQSWAASSTYLFAFVVSSTLCMGIFAAAYGELTKRVGSTADSVELGLRVFSSSCSVIVGLLWLVLSVLGKLEDFFH